MVMYLQVNCSLADLILFSTLYPVFVDQSPLHRGQCVRHSPFLSKFCFKGMGMNNVMFKGVDCVNFK